MASLTKKRETKVKDLSSIGSLFSGNEIVVSKGLSEKPSCWKVLSRKTPVKPVKEVIQKPPYDELDGLPSGDFSDVEAEMLRQYEESQRPPVKKAPEKVQPAPAVLVAKEEILMSIVAEAEVVIPVRAVEKPVEKVPVAIVPEQKKPAPTRRVEKEPIGLAQWVNRPVCIDCGRDYQGQVRCPMCRRSHAAKRRSCN